MICLVPHCGVFAGICAIAASPQPRKGITAQRSGLNHVSVAHHEMLNIRYLIRWRLPTIFILE